MYFEHEKSLKAAGSLGNGIDIAIAIKKRSAIIKEKYLHIIVAASISFMFSLDRMRQDMGKASYTSIVSPQVLMGYV